MSNSLKHCPSCGTQLAEESLFCSNCGQKQQARSTVPQASLDPILEISVNRCKRWMNSLSSVGKFIAIIGIIANVGILILVDIPSEAQDIYIGMILGGGLLWWLYNVLGKSSKSLEASTEDSQINQKELSKAFNSLGTYFILAFIVFALQMLSTLLIAKDINDIGNADVKIESDSYHRNLGRRGYD